MNKVDLKKILKKKVFNLHKDSPISGTVLIQGESGSGKELVARLVACGQTPFISVNCSTIPETLFDSELFTRFSSSDSLMGEFVSLALLTNTGRVSSVVSPITTGTPFLMMSAFSEAIFSSVSPRNCVWSGLMLVIMQRSGVMMFVQSSRPPNPTSMMATST